MNCEHLIEGYFSYLAKNLIETKEDGVCRLELPFPRPSGDSIFLKISPLEDKNCLISDDGFMEDYLFTYGIDLWSLRAEGMKDIFDNVIKRYKIEKEHYPEIVIKVYNKKLFHGIFQMSNIMNELTTLKLLSTPTPVDVFKGSVESFFKKNNIKFERNRKLKIQIHQKTYPFEFEFAFRSQGVYTKIITSNTIVKDWAVNFDQIKKFYKTENKHIKLWALYNDKDSVKKSRINDFLSDYADEIVAWSQHKEKFFQFK